MIHAVQGHAKQVCNVTVTEDETLSHHQLTDYALTVHHVQADVRSQGCLPILSFSEYINIELSSTGESNLF